MFKSISTNLDGLMALCHWRVVSGARVRPSIRQYHVGIAAASLLLWPTRMLLPTLLAVPVFVLCAALMTVVPIINVFLAAFGLWIVVPDPSPFLPRDEEGEEELRAKAMREFVGSLVHVGREQDGEGLDKVAAEWAKLYEQCLNLAAMDEDG